MPAGRLLGGKAAERSLAERYRLEHQPAHAPVHRSMYYYQFSVQITVGRRPVYQISCSNQLPVIPFKKLSAAICKNPSYQIPRSKTIREWISHKSFERKEVIYCTIETQRNYTGFWEFYGRRPGENGPPEEKGGGGLTRQDTVQSCL